MKKSLVLFIILTQSISAQITGTVTDIKNEPLPFVNIYIENTYKGTTTNELGVYELNLSEKKTYTLIFQYLGYKTKKQTISIDKFPFEVNVALEETSVSLNEVVINSEENPANAIIRKAIAKRKENLKKINDYKADFYSRGIIRMKDVPEKFLGQEVGDLDGSLDSTRSGVIYLSETVSKLEFLRPDKLKERIIASKVSGNDAGVSFNTAMDVDFNFYENNIELGINTISPIANNAFSYYRYKLEGMFYDDRGNMINVISVIPKRENDPVYSGKIYIVEDQWSIYGLELDITGTQSRIPAIDKMTLKQNFSFSEKDDLWSLNSQSLDFKVAFFGFKADGRFTAVYTNYEYNQSLTNKDFNRELVYFEKEANKKDSTYWDKIRPVPLTKEEVDDYIKKDSIRLVRDSKTYKDSVDRVNNKFKLMDIISGYEFENSYKNCSIGFNSPIEAIRFNTVQGWNADLSTYFVKNFNDYKRFLRINSTINYGFSDDRLRGTISGVYKFNDIKKPVLSLSGGVTVAQFNPSNPISNLLNTSFSLFNEENFMKVYERSYAQVAYSQEVFNGLRASASLSYERRTPLFNTTDQTWYPNDNRIYTSNNPLNPLAFGVAPFKTHNIMKFNLNARIDFDQDYLTYPDSKFNVSSRKYPTLYLGYEKGFGATNSDYNFDQIKARIFQDIRLADKGSFTYNLKAGKFFNADDISFVDFQHFNGNQTNIGNGQYLNVFNNLPYYAASTNDAYAEFHSEYDFNGYLLGKIPLLNKLNFNLILGAHALFTPEHKPYQEYTIGLDNIGWGKYRFLRVDYLRSYQSGFVSDAVLIGFKLF